VARSALPRIGLLALIWGSAFLWIKLADRRFSPVEVTGGIALPDSPAQGEAADLRGAYRPGHAVAARTIESG